MLHKVQYYSGIGGALLFLLTSVAGMISMAPQNPLHHFISESYAVGSPHGDLMRYAGFIPSGILLAISAFSAPALVSRSWLTTALFIAVGIFYGLGTVITGIFPCDAGCNPEMIDPSMSQIIHNASGALTYITVPFLLIILGMQARKWPVAGSLSTATLVLGVIALLFVAPLSSNPTGSFIGFYQWMVEGAILTWFVLLSLYIKQRAPMK